MVITVVRSAGAEGDEAQVGYCSVVRNTLHDFWDSTTLAGLSHSRQRHPVMKLVWVLLFLAGLAATVFDVYNVINNYSQRPYSTQMKPKNVASTMLPAITVCNQNSIQCSKLLSLMFEKMRSDDINLSKDLEQLYLISQCAFKTLKCDLVLLEYQKHLEYLGDTGKIPVTLMKGDTCMDCEVMIKMWSEECEENPLPPQPYDFWWKRNNCTNNFFNVEGVLKSLKLNKLPDSLDECPRQPPAPMPVSEGNSSLSSMQTSSGNDSAQFSLDDLPEGSQDDSRKSSDDSISSTPGLDELRGGTESNLSPTTDTPLNTVDSATDSVTSDKAKTPGDPDVTSRRKREAKSKLTGDGNLQVYTKKRMESSQQYNNKVNFLTQYMRLSDDIKKQLGYSFEDLILDCKFMGYNCTNSRSA
ncbi:Acid-sensing ion channel 5 [Portunus trituberculatus]|uniref:Acid-sensing ion channel 5 n=1 Tax=Portunus trituberculatus TaxID=210409 RepID=A0A5B7GQL1_PORTR|nr:Acid-sensing ion channel 5 [Portunus trituberculatus]